MATYHGHRWKRPLSLRRSFHEKRRRSNKFSLINLEAEEQESLEEQQDAEDHQSVEDDITEDLPLSHER